MTYSVILQRRAAAAFHDLCVAIEIVEEAEFGFIKLNKWNARYSDATLCLQLHHYALPLYPIVREYVIYAPFLVYSATEVSSLSTNESFSWTLTQTAVAVKINILVL
jgi:hypothetical protein